MMNSRTNVIFPIEMKALEGLAREQRANDDERKEGVQSDFVDWLERMFFNHYDRQAERREQWTKDMALVANDEFRIGNLTAALADTIANRLVVGDWNVTIDALDGTDDQVQVERAEAAQTVARAIVNASGMESVARQVVTDAIACPFGVFGMGHPVDPYYLDFMVSARSPGTVPVETDDIEDVWEDVDIEEAASLGIAVVDDGEDMKPGKKVAEMDFDNAINDSGATSVFSSGFAQPHIRRIDPRTVVMPTTTLDPRRADWVAHVQFYTRPELEALVEGLDEDDIENIARFTDLYEQTEGVINDVRSFDIGDGAVELIAVVDVYFRRCRPYPQYNGVNIAFIPGIGNERTRVIKFRMRPHGGIIPFEFVKLLPNKPVYSNSIAFALRPYTDLYDTMFRGIAREMEEFLYRPWLFGENTGMTDTDIKAFISRKKRGFTKIRSPEEIRKHVPADFPMEIVNMLGFIESGARAAGRENQFDQGIPMKGVTANQVDLIQRSSGIRTESMAAAMNDALRYCIMKMMHLVGVFSLGMIPVTVQYGGKIASFDRGARDFSRALHYKVSVVSGEPKDETPEALLMFRNALMYLREDQDMAAFFDKGVLSREFAKRFGISPAAMNNHSAAKKQRDAEQRRQMEDQARIAALRNGAGGATMGGTPGAPGLPVMPDENAGPMGALGGAGLPPMPSVDGASPAGNLSLQDRLRGQHAERAIGDQVDASGGMGDSLAAAMAGSANIGARR